MRRIIVLLSCLIFVTSCAAKEQEVSKDEGMEAEETAVHMEHLKFSVDVSRIEDGLAIRPMLENTSDENVTVTFPSSQQFEVIVASSEGKEVYRYSKGRMFTQALTEVTIAPGEKKEWEAVWENGTASGQMYSITASLLPIEINGKQVDQKAFTDTLPYNVDGSTLDVSVEVEGATGVYTVSGTAATEVGQAYYAVTEGHVMLVEETAIDISKPWKVQITIPKDKLPVNGTLIMELYTKGKGQKLKAIVLEQFQ